jgi:histidine triad (HIT) family protein
MTDCIFCKIANKSIPADIVFESENVLAFRDIAPKAPVHVVIIPKKHINPLLDLEEEDIVVIPEIYMAARTIAADAGVDETGYRVLTNTGPDAGQEVEHLHWHLLGGARLGDIG